ncbi:unnamed protein product [Rotaria magnacalcarata]
MTPHDDTDRVWEVIIENSKTISLSNDSLDKNASLILTSLAEAYNNAQHWTVRRQILSIMAKDVTFSIILIFIPGLTAYRFYKARQHADFEGKGTVVDDTRGTTIRYDDYQLEHFIEFLVSPHICTDLPFGERELHLSTGETLLIPLTIRNLAPKRIIVQYYNYCKEYYGDAFHPLGQSTLFSILNQCSASTRRSLQGLDSFSAEGSTAFDLLISIVDSLSTVGLTAIDATNLKKDLQHCRNYLKSDYKVHVSSESNVPDHCSTFALSDITSKCWQRNCDHDHDQQCDRCELLKITLAKLRAFIEQYQTDTAVCDRLLYRVQQQVQDIKEWKAHLLRTIHQDQARIDILHNLDSETVMIQVDWAMKWLPVKYRESTKDHFAKRGISWHLAYVIRKKFSESTSSSDSSFTSEENVTNRNPNNYTFQHKTFCHVFDQCVQNAKTVISILRHICLMLQQTEPDIKYVHLRSDNAGCYHSAEALLSVEQLFNETGIWIKSIDFCDPQSGKGPCDHIAAVVKCSIRRFVNEKNNCTNAIEFLTAAERTNGVEFYASEIQNSHTEKIEWKGVKQINNIEYILDFTPESTKPSIEVRAWQSWKIGPGKVYRWLDFEKTVQKINPLHIFHSKNVSIPWINDCHEKAGDVIIFFFVINNLFSFTDENRSNHSYQDESSSTEDENEEESNVNHTSTSEKEHYFFDCLTSGCTARYRSYANLLRHYATGKHKMKLEKHSLIDKSKILFHQHLSTNHLRSTPLMSITVIQPVKNPIISSLSKNWASHKPKPSVRFNDKQKQFLLDKFNEGVNTGMKWDPSRVALDMEVLTNNGTYVFNNDECLSQGQVKSYFSRLALKQRSMEQVSDEQTKKKAISHSSSTTNSNATNLQSNNTTITSEFDEMEEIDTRDLEVYSWRQILDETKKILDTPSISSPSSITSPSLKRKPTLDD